MSVIFWDLSFGDELQLFISKEQSKNEKIRYQFKFDFSTFGISTNPGKPDNSFLEAANKQVVQTSIYTLELEKGNTIENDEGQDGRILDYQVRSNGNIIVASDFSLKEYSKSGSMIKEFLGHTAGVRTVTVSKDGRYMVSGSEDQTIRIWKLTEKGELPSMRDVFESVEWQDYFAQLEVDSLTYQASEQAWKGVITYLKEYGDKT